MSIPVMVYNLAPGKFAEVHYPSERAQTEENLSICNSNLPPLEAIPNAPVRQDIPWPSTESAPDNLFETRKDWPNSSYASTHSENRNTTLSSSNPP